jgi:hypothetical protein
VDWEVVDGSTSPLIVHNKPPITAEDSFQGGSDAQKSVKGGGSGGRTSLAK